MTRGLPTDRTLLFVIDGAQGLRRAITDVFGGATLPDSQVEERSRPSARTAARLCRQGVVVPCRLMVDSRTMSPDLESIPFGVGCFYFVPTEPASGIGQSARYIELVRGALEAIPNTNNIVIEGGEEPDSLLLPLEGRWTSLDAPVFNAYPSHLNIEFDLYIPVRIQETDPSAYSSEICRLRALPRQAGLRRHALGDGNRHGTWWLENWVQVHCLGSGNTCGANSTSLSLACLVLGHRHSIVISFSNWFNNKTVRSSCVERNPRSDILSTGVAIATRTQIMMTMCVRHFATCSTN